MKFTIPLALILQAITALAAPAVSPQADSAAAPVSVNDGDVSPEPAAGPPAWHLDCGSPGTTSMCSASNSGAHCDPITGTLTIILQGTCGGCKCISSDQCTGRCG
ncbi:hypothetical protein F4802DRAFT_308568 [Xylaria palmicola]|nr:hypothetical protein F4802DRAFT_308568 [Xylaria palmicola]